jgi:Putative beta-barrel porin-2, OmpL-like. bbp2
VFRPIRCIAAAILVAPLVSLADGPTSPGSPPVAAAEPSSAASAPAAAGAPADSKPAEPAKPPPWYTAVTLSGTVDAYYQLRLDAAQDAPLAQRAFDGPTGFTLGHAVLSAAMAPAPAGFRIDLDFGNTASVIDAVSAAAAGTSGNTVGNHVLQAYAAMKLGPAELDLGRFVTSAGAEVVPAKDNWLYSRSLLFNLIPITHTGARVTVPVNEQISVRVGVSNGWDVVNTSYAGKTAEVQAAYSGPNSTTVALTGYFGPNPTLWSGALNTGSSWRSLVDLVAGTTVGPLGLNLNVDYGNEAGNSWYGAAVMARYSLPGDALRVTGRFEYVKDENGVRFATGTDTNLWELTAGASCPVGSNSEIRLEFRLDKASQNVFTPASGPKDTQATATLAALVWF